MRIASVLVMMMVLSGCMSLLKPGDWENLDKKLESIGMDKAAREAQIAEWQEKEAEQAEALVSMGKEIKDLAIDIGGTMAGLPDPLKDASKDWTDELMKWIILGGGGATALGVGRIGYKKVKNSPPGKLVGPANPVSPGPTPDQMVNYLKYIADRLPQSPKSGDAGPPRES